MYKPWPEPQKTNPSQLVVACKRLLYPFWPPLLREAKLAFLIVYCLSLVACSGVGKTTFPVTEKAPLTTHPEAIANIGTPTFQEDATNTVSPTFAAVTTTPTVSPTPSPSSTPTALLCWAQGGRFELGELESEQLPDPLSFRIYLPPCYDMQLERHYPVLYMIHGQSSNDDQWERLGVGSVLDELVAEGELPPMLVVMPRDRVWKEPTEDNFGRAVAEELVPWIDGRYRTLPEREYRAVGGLSRGGAWALHLGMEYWDVFGSMGAHSGFIFHTDVNLVKDWLEEIPFEDLPRIYMDAGDKDRPPILQSARWFEELLTRRGIPHEWHIYSGYHEESYWQAHVEDYLRWYAQAWEMVIP